MAIIQRAPGHIQSAAPLIAPGASTHKPEDLRAAVKAAFIGTFIEWFDYASYLYMSAIVALVFFPELEG